MTEKVSSKDISAAALRVFSREELTQMPEPSRLSLGVLISKRLKKEGPPPTLEELQGIRELVTQHLWHPALSQLSEASQASPTPKPET